MKLDELYTHIANDFVIEETEIGRESIKSGNLFIKYSRLWTEEKLKLEQLLNMKAGLINEKREYYSGNAPAEVYKEKPFDIRLKTDSGIMKYVEADPEVIKYNDRIVIQGAKVDLLTECMKELKNRNYQLKVALDDLKFKNGEF